VSTAQATDSKPNSEHRWFRVKLPPNLQKNLPQADLPEIDRIFDAYWGGPERRITGLTLRILAVNALALLTLVIGILYLGEYQNKVITTKLQNFENETRAITAALTFNAPNSQKALLQYYADEFAKEIKLLHQNGHVHIHVQPQSPPISKRREFASIRMLKDLTGFVLGLLPNQRHLEPYPRNTIQHPDVIAARNGNIRLSAWQNQDEKIILSAASPIIAQGKILLIKDNHSNIEESVTDVWTDVLRIFGVTLLITIALSIYLSGVIARPLKRLAKAAEAVRTGRAKTTDIPDFSHRYDEIGELSIALKSMIAALFERMDSIDRFAADVAHELKNPLTSLKSAIETLGKVKKAEDKKKLMDIITHDIARMDRLITDISAASRLDAELSREAFTPIQLKTLLTDIIETYQAPLKRGKRAQAKTKNNIEIVFEDLTSYPAITLGSTERLAQVFHNIIDNALSFSPKKEQVIITLSKEGKSIQITIEDQGKGIPEAKLETIFERFYTERPDADYGQNSGLGLSICKQIIDAHDGEIHAENTENGAKFTITLKTL